MTRPVIALLWEFGQVYIGLLETFLFYLVVHLTSGDSPWGILLECGAKCEYKSADKIVQRAFLTLDFTSVEHHVFYFKPQTQLQLPYYPHII